MVLPLLFLHGAIGSSAQLKPLADAFASKGFAPELLNFSGHGGQPIPSQPFSIKLFAEEVIQWLDSKRIDAIDIFGYSMGGYVALCLAKHYPARVGKIITVATKLAWDVPTAEKEVRMLNPDKIAEKIPKFAATLEQRHAPVDWKEVLNRTAEMMLAMGTNPPLTDEDFRAINHRVLMCVGDNDSMVSREETNHVHQLIPNSGFKVLENTPHPIEQMNVSLIKETVVGFFNGEQ